MAVGVAPLRQRLRYLDRPERTHVAVVIAALGDRIDVGAEQNGERPRLRAGSGADDVAGGIDPRVEARAGSQPGALPIRSEEHTSELQSRGHLVCRLLLEKK